MVERKSRIVARRRRVRERKSVRASGPERTPGTTPLHAEVVRRILESFFGTPPPAPPADVGALLRLWLDVAGDARVAVPDRDVTTKYTGKAKKIASKLLALRGGTSTLAAVAHALAIAGRRARAGRWTSWQTGDPVSLVE